jgi:hypothetical protein
MLLSPKTVLVFVVVELASSRVGLVQAENTTTNATTTTTNTTATTTTTTTIATTTNATTTTNTTSITTTTTTITTTTNATNATVSGTTAVVTTTSKVASPTKVASTTKVASPTKAASTTKVASTTKAVTKAESPSTTVEKKKTMKSVGSFTLKVSNATAFRTNPMVKVALQEAVAKSIDNVETKDVTITGITSVRRVAEANGRRLSAGSVKVEYEIAHSGVAIKKSDIIPKDLMKNINDRVKANGVTGAEVTELPVVAEITNVQIGTATTTMIAIQPVSSGALTIGSSMPSLAALSAFTTVLALVG